MGYLRHRVSSAASSFAAAPLQLAPGALFFRQLLVVFGTLLLLHAPPAVDAQSFMSGGGGGGGDCQVRARTLLFVSRLRSSYYARYEARNAGPACVREITKLQQPSEK
jgi:hypothetical protein